MLEQEYELVDQLQNRERLEQQYATPAYSQSNSHESISTRSSTDSTSSEVFDNIESATNQRGSTEDNFHQDDFFQLAWVNYGQSKKSRFFRIFSSKFGCYILFGVTITLWIIALFIYSKENHSRILLAIRPDGSSAKVVHTKDQNITLSEYNPQFQNISMTSFYKGTYLPLRIDITWLNKRQYPTKSQNTIKDGGGYYFTRAAGGSYIVKQIDSGDAKTDTFINFGKFAYENNFFTITDVILNPARPVDQIESNWHILVTDSSVQWRHLTFALYWVFNPLTNEFIPIQPPPSSLEKASKESELFKSRTLFKLHFAEFSPEGNFISFGYDHDLFIYTLATGEIKQVTNTGAIDVYNGKADWIYEEEVISNDKLYWWSPDEAHLVYVSLNDSKVHEYELDYYVKSAEEIFNSYEESPSEKSHDLNQYPVKSTIRYPKPGTLNPRASIFDFKLSDLTTKEIVLNDGSAESDFIVYAGQWLDSDSFVLKLSDRSSRFLKKKVFKASENKVHDVIDIDAYTQFGGWVTEPIQMTTVGEKGGYVDLLVEANRTHLYYFESVLASSPSFPLTKSSEWEVIDTQPITYDKINNCVYFLATKRGPMDAHLMSVDLSSHKVKDITGTDKDGKYSIDFSEDGQYLNLVYEGPLQPWQKLINMAHLHEHEHAEDLENCDSIIEEIPNFNNVKTLNTKLASSNLPTKVYRQILVNPGNIHVNVIEILPPNFNPEKKDNKYPIFVNIYAGPGSQMTQKVFSIGFAEVISATLNTIVLIIDPRGCGPYWASRSFSGHGQLGTWESRDIIAVTKEYIKINSEFINEDRVAIWGWSYGGYTTLKTLEIDNGETFKYGMAVAPVTNWLFYDSIYTERYLWLPEGQGFAAYDRSQIGNFANFKNVKRFLLVQGTSDDNVHIQNLYWLLDKFNLERVENYDLQIFPDSDHSITYHKATTIIYDKLIHWLGDAFSGKFDNLA